MSIDALIEHGVTHDVDPLNLRVRQLRMEEEARSIVRREQAAQGLTLPPERDSYTVECYLADPRPPRVMRIAGLQGEKHFTVLAAQFKTGKTTLTANLACSLADDKPFLENFNVTPAPGRVGFFNGEMDEEDFLEYLMAAGLKNTDGVAIWNLRGYGVDMLSDAGRAATVDWLKANQVDYWILDPWASFCSFSGVNEDKNNEVAPLVQAVFQIAQEAGVVNILVVHHSGWDGTRMRGATALPSAADTIWQYTSDDDGIRELRAFGRGVTEAKGVVAYDGETLTYTGESRPEVKRTSARDAALVYFTERPDGVSKGTAYEQMPFGRQKNTRIVKELLDTGLIAENQRGREHILTATQPADAPEI